MPIRIVPALGANEANEAVWGRRRNRGHRGPRSGASRGVGRGTLDRKAELRLPGPPAAPAGPGRLSEGPSLEARASEALLGRPNARVLNEAELPTGGAHHRVAQQAPLH
eukprot:6045256-Alexandrium_andersonii.AAC.1